MRKLCLSTKFPHKETRWNYGIFRCANFFVLNFYVRSDSHTIMFLKYVHWSQFKTCFGHIIWMMWIGVEILPPFPRQIKKRIVAWQDCKVRRVIFENINNLSHHSKVTQSLFPWKTWKVFNMDVFIKNVWTRHKNFNPCSLFLQIND